MTGTQATECPRCGGALLWVDGRPKCDGKGCSRQLVEWALNGGPPADPNGYVADAEVVPQRASAPPALDELMDTIVGFIRAFVAMTEEQAAAVALWTLHTHTFAAANATPYLSITSAEKESGKTRLLEVLELLVARPWLTGRATAAVLPRKIDAERPTLLLDESDAAFKGDKEYAETLRGVLNTGHRRGGKTTVCVGQGAEIGFKDFATYNPKAIAGIGKLPDTVQSRSIPVRLKRRGPGEQVERFRYEDAKWQAEPLRSALELVADEIITKAAAAHPELPDELGDRAQDCWEPLLALADLAGGEWPNAARAAACTLSGNGTVDDDSVGVLLLSDLRTVFGGSEHMTTESLLDVLHGLDESPWGDWYGKPITARVLGRLLKPYEVKPRSVRIGDVTRKGYVRESLEDAWRRYLPLEDPSIRHSGTTRSQSGIEANSDPAQTLDVPDTKSGANPHEHWDVPDVPDRDAQGPAEEELERLRAKFPEGAR